jgi:hypothetical protein
MIGCTNFPKCMNRFDQDHKIFIVINLDFKNLKK